MLNTIKKYIFLNGKTVVEILFSFRLLYFFYNNVCLFFILFIPFRKNFNSKIIHINDFYCKLYVGGSVDNMEGDNEQKVTSYSWGYWLLLKIFNSLNVNT